MSSPAQPLPPGYRSVQDFLLRCHNRKSVYQQPANLNQKQKKKKDKKKYKVQPCLSQIPEATESTKPNSNSRYYYEGAYKNSTIPSELPNPDSINFHRI